MSNENLSRSTAADRSKLITVRSYDVHVDVSSAEDPSVAGFSTVSVIDFDAAVPGAATFLDFIGDDVRRIELNGRALDVAQVRDGARLHLADLAATNRVIVSAVALYSRSGEGLHRFVDPTDGRTYLYTQFEPADARRVFANFEQPDLKASFTFSVTAPSGWEVASNGAEVARTPLDGGRSRWDFAPTRPISTYITTILAGPYFKAQDAWSSAGSDLEVPLAAYCRSSIAEHFDPERIFALTKAGLDFFCDLFAYPYPFGKYDQAFVPEYNLGAMENPGLVTFTEAYVFTSRATRTQYQGRANTLLHEMAHMWFGDLVTMRWWDDLWLKESFADYMGHLAVAEATEFGADSWLMFADKRKAWAYAQDQLPTTHPIVADIRNLEAAKQNFDGITYAKGASALKQLVAYVGFDNFIAGAREYFRAHAYSNTTLSDLLAPLNEASGRDLTDWSSAWLQTSGVSTLSVHLEEDDDGVISTASILQTSVDPGTGVDVVRPHRLRVGSFDWTTDGDLERTASFGMDLAGRTTDAPELLGRRRPALILLNDADLTYAKVQLDTVSLQTALDGIGRVTDPLARALLWSSLWADTRDGVLPAADFLDAVVRHSPRERDPGALATLLGNAQTAVAHYAFHGQRQDLHAGLVAVVAEQLSAATAGSDLQRVWARTLARLGRRTDAGHQLIEGLLAGSHPLAGLEIDPELRWALVQALAATGHADQKRLDAELDRDRTAAGYVGHRLATAARPLPEAKDAAWTAALNDQSLTNDLLSATIEGFQAGPPELRQNYAESYFSVLRGVWERMSIELASRIVRGLYPQDADLAPGQEPEEQPVLRHSAAWLDTNTDAPPALRRIVLEQQDGLLRSLRAQRTAQRKAG